MLNTNPNKIGSLDEDLARLITWKKFGQISFSSPTYHKSNRDLELFDWSRYQNRPLLVLPNIPQIQKSLNFKFVDEVRNDSQDEYELFASLIVVFDQDVFTMRFCPFYAEGFFAIPFMMFEKKYRSLSRYLFDCEERGSVAGNSDDVGKRVQEAQSKRDGMKKKLRSYYENIVVIEKVLAPKVTSFHYPEEIVDFVWIQEAVNFTNSTYGPPEKLNHTPYLRWFSQTGLSLEHIYKIFSCFNKTLSELESDFQNREVYFKRAASLGFIMHEACKSSIVW